MAFHNKSKVNTKVAKKALLIIKIMHSEWLDFICSKITFHEAKIIDIFCKQI